jgi:hypothetical protein
VLLAIREGHCLRLGAGSDGSSKQLFIDNISKLCNNAACTSCALFVSTSLWEGVNIVSDSQVYPTSYTPKYGKYEAIRAIAAAALVAVAVLLWAVGYRWLFEYLKEEEPFDYVEILVFLGLIAFFISVGVLIGAGSLAKTGFFRWKSQNAHRYMNMVSGMSFPLDVPANAAAAGKAEEVTVLPGASSPGKVVFRTNTWYTNSQNGSAYGMRPKTATIYQDGGVVKVLEALLPAAQPESQPELSDTELEPAKSE